MKRFAIVGLVVIMSLLMVIPASAQIFGIGVKGGLNFANLRGDIVIPLEDFEISTDLKNKTGIVIGASFSSSLLPFISLQPEILYTEKGAKFGESIQTPFGDISAEGTIDLKYLEIPVLLRFSPPFPMISPFVYAGPAFAFNLSADLTIEAQAVGFQISESEDIKDDIRNFDMGFVIGGGLEFGIPLLKFHVEARYTTGLSNIVDNEFEDDIDLKNGVFSLMVGVTF